MRQRQKATSLAYPFASKVKIATFFDRYAGPLRATVFNRCLRNLSQPSRKVSAKTTFDTAATATLKLDTL